jgi:hypothetical protein
MSARDNIENRILNIRRALAFDPKEGESAAQYATAVADEIEHQARRLIDDCDQMRGKAATPWRAPLHTPKERSKPCGSH